MCSMGASWRRPILSRPRRARSARGEYVRLSRELAELDPVAAQARALAEAERELSEAEALIADPASDREMRALAEEERLALRARIDRLRDELRVMLIPRDAADD